MAFVMLLGVLFSSTYSSFNYLIEFECKELCDFGDADNEEENNKKEKDDKVQMAEINHQDMLNMQALYIAEMNFLQAHQYLEICTPPPEHII